LTRIVSGARRLWDTSTTIRVAAITVVIIAAIVFSAVLQGDVLNDFVSGGTDWVRHLLHRYTYLASYGLLYVEESGIPLPAPGDVFVAYVGAHVPRNVAAWIIAWLGLIGVVVIGATNLFWLSRRFGRRLAEGRFAHLVHLSPERLARAERWFQRYGVVAIIFGRHIPGFRVPITVAAGVFKVHYPVFAASVAVSTAIWAGVVMIIGITVGPRLEAFLTLHRDWLWLWAAVVVLFVIVTVTRRRPKPTGGSVDAAGHSGKADPAVGPT
jgi:membrane protein DedA with SNARE-associated domain